MSIALKPVLARHEIKELHERSLEVLERVGIDYKTPRALEILEKMAKVEKNSY